jgi:hypothetical protein
MPVLILLMKSLDVCSPKAKVTRSNRVGCAMITLHFGFGSEAGFTMVSPDFGPAVSRRGRSRPYFSRQWIARPTEGEADMSERLETLKKARERMVEDRDAFAKTLAAPFDRDKAERARLKFIESQALIDAIDRAIEGEQSGPAAAA